MNIRVVENFAELAPYADRWDDLSQGCPFRSWVWLSTWWKHYAPGRSLKVLLLFDEQGICSGKQSSSDGDSERLVAILPMYLEFSRTQGRLLRLMGDGEVCSEHLDLLCEASHLTSVAETIADYLTRHADEWDALSLSTFAEGHRAFDVVLAALTLRGFQINRRAGTNCWSIALPQTWEDFLALQSKSHRKQLRQMKSRVLDSPRARWIDVETNNDFDLAWEVLIDLHQRRRQSLGEPGCFAFPAWANFHREVALELLAAENLRLSVLELDGRPVAAEYHLAGGNAIYAYQGGIDPDRRADEPGQLSLIHCITKAIEEGRTRFELLRGDESYKPHWRALPIPTVDIQVVAPHALARWRHYSWNSLRRAARFVRGVTNLLS